ncbi:hypothetical protein FRC16_007636 [Serendipita sp. 398]|nr:hypothetical protein FRC16_007636 [Serendipita sp. 398]
MPTGFKNSTDGTISIAIDACRAARSGHVFLSVGKEGLSSIVETEGNEDVHIILRGGSSGPNYERQHVQKCIDSLQKGGVNWRLMIDCSHGNSLKQHSRQPLVAEDIAQQLESGDTGTAIMGVMIESNIEEGKQDIPAGGREGLKYGVSVTDGESAGSGCLESSETTSACISWNNTIAVLDRLREGVRARRSRCEKKDLL